MSPGLESPAGRALAGLTVLERGWLSSNNVVIHAAADEAGAVVVDTGHVNHAAQTVALVGRALGGQTLACIVNTHLHSDHCGGNAALHEAHRAPVWVPPGMQPVVRAWDAARLTYEATGQRCARFEAHAELSSQRGLNAGGRHWEVLAAPGHDPDSVMLFDREHGVLISADALWEHGYGVVFPEIVGEPGFDDVAEVLELIASLPVRVVIPGHGAAFTDVRGALGRARARLAGQKADPERHARHAGKVLMKYHLMEVGRQPLQDLLDWAAGSLFLRELWERHGRGRSRAPGAWARALLEELVAAGALTVDGETVIDAPA